MEDHDTTSEYPRVLIVTGGRINASDAANNGLLLRNLFACWPRESLAQIYSSADNGDAGFFGRYYQLGPQDRRWGALFYGLKSRQLHITDTESTASGPQTVRASAGSVIRRIAAHAIVDTGLYEHIYRPRLTPKLIDWVDRFQPDIILAQGYSLTFSWLPVMLAQRFAIPIAYYPTDDWPSASYTITRGGLRVISQFVRRSVDRAAQHLVHAASVRLAFNRYMQEEYVRRYRCPFDVLMHGDTVSRYRAIAPIRSAETGGYVIVATGIFTPNRLDLLNDLESACRMLAEKHMIVSATVFSVNTLPDAVTQKFRFVRFEPCPSHEGLASVMKAADILFLPERFDETAGEARLSVSSKAHLFMYSGRPIIVYSHPVTGVARYAVDEGWAKAVLTRDPTLLAAAIESLITDSAEIERLVASAAAVAARNHDLDSIRATFHRLMYRATHTGNGEEVNGAVATDL